MARIPSYTGTDSESPERPEIEQFGNCPICGALVDMPAMNLPTNEVFLDRLGDLMRPTLLVLLCSAYISTCAAEGLKEPRRTSFVDAAFKSCFKSQTENPLNKGLGSAVMAQY